MALCSNAGLSTSSSCFTLLACSAGGRCRWRGPHLATSRRSRSWRASVSNAPAPIWSWKDTCAMFTGIVESLGRFGRLRPSDAGGRIEIAFETPLAPDARPLLPGQSIAVNGCCLTVVDASREAFLADLSPETIQRTTFGSLKAGALVNLERPLTAGAELGGHFVLGHVD